MKRILIITYHYEPRESIGSLRLKGLSKYLPKYRFEPIILTPLMEERIKLGNNIIQTPYPGDVFSIWKKRLGLKADLGLREQVGIAESNKVNDSSLIGHILNIIKAIIAFPDEQKGWIKYAVRIGRTLLKNGNISLILSSSHPVTCHVIAKELKTEFGVSWVADLRDLWTQNPYYNFPLLRKIIERRLELNTLKYADALVTVSSPLAEQLKLLHKRKPVYAILNGFDPDDVGTSDLTKEFSITYTGQLYQGKRDPDLLFRAINELILEGEINQSIIKVRFYGEKPNWLEEKIRSYNLSNIVELNNKIPRNLSLLKQRESQILLLLRWSNPKEEGIYTGKLFEYLAAKRPILSIGGPQDDVGLLLNSTRVGYHINSLNELKRTLSIWYNEYLRTGMVSYNGRWNEIIKYSQLEMARKFSELFSDIIKKV